MAKNKDPALSNIVMKELLQLYLLTDISLIFILFISVFLYEVSFNVFILLAVLFIMFHRVTAMIYSYLGIFKRKRWWKVLFS